MLKEKSDQQEKSERKIEELNEKISSGKQREKELMSKYIKEKNTLKEVKESLNEQMKEIESENLRLKGTIKTMKK